MAEVATILGERLSLKLSPSFLQRAACPLCLKWTYIDKLVTRYARTSTLRGQAAHLAIARLTAVCLGETIAPTQLADVQLRTAIADAASHELYPELGKIFSWLQLWRDRIDLDPDHLVGFEEKMAIDEHYRDTDWDVATYRGIVDTLHIVATTAIIQDYKSQPNILSGAALDQHEQGSFYCWLVSKFYPQIEEYVFRIWYLRYGFYSETHRTRQDVQLFEHRLLLQKQKLTDIRDWQPIAGDHCGLCDFIHLCPLGQNPSTLPGEIITRDQAERVAAELRVKEEWVKEAKTKLKVYVEHNDPIELPGYGYGYRASESVEWNAELVQEIMRDEGLPVGNYLYANRKVLDKLAKRAAREEGELLQRLEAARACKTKTSFRGYKLADPDDSDGSDDETE